MFLLRVRFSRRSYFVSCLVVRLWMCVCLQTHFFQVRLPFYTQSLKSGANSQYKINDGDATHTQYQKRLLFGVVYRAFSIWCSHWTTRY